MKKSIVVVLMAVVSFAGISQSVKSDYYFVTKQDTVFCQKLSYSTTNQGFLSSISYTDMKGNETSIKGKKKVPDVVTFYMKGSYYDKVPLKANKPKKYIRYDRRQVDGKLKVYLAHQGSMSTTTMNMSTGRTTNSSAPMGSYRFFVKMPDGKYYQINKAKNMNKVIKPFLLACEEFKNQYKGDFSRKEEPAMEMFRLYNSLCK
ncbi:MAG TPA: hypothetical protein VK177_21510 [Flavobacteriales bacterium]|nr:hypothetical protein [Flavobacteriales bacterium]